MTENTAIEHAVTVLCNYGVQKSDAKILAHEVVRRAIRDIHGGVRLGTATEISNLLRERARDERSWPHPSPKDLELANKLEIAARMINGDLISLNAILREIERRLDLPVIDNADMREYKALKTCQEALRGLLGESEDHGKEPKQQSQ